MRFYLQLVLCIAGACLANGLCHAQTNVRAVETAGEPLTSGKLALLSITAASNRPDSALLMAEEGLALAEKEKNPSGYAGCLNAKGWAYYKLGNTDSGELYLQKAIEAFQQLKNRTDEARGLINLSAIYTDKGAFEKSLKYLLRARSLLESTNDESGKAYVEKMIGILYRDQGQYAKAVGYFKSAISDFGKIGQMTYVADATSSLGSLYNMTGNYDSAFAFYNSALETYTKEKNKNGAAYVCEDFGETYFKLSDEKDNRWLDSSLKYYQKAYDLFNQLQNPENIAFEKLMMGKVLIAKGQKEGAIEYLEAALKNFDSGKAYSYAYETLDKLSALYSKTGNYQKGYEYARKALVYKDSIEAKSRKDIVANLLGKYELDKKDRTIALLHAEQSDQRKLNIIFLILAVGIVGIGFILFRHYRVRHQLKEVQMRNQIADDLHDEIGSSLSSILLLSKIGLDERNEAGRQHGILLSKIKGNASEVIERMRDIVWTTNPKFDEGESFREKIESYLTELRQMSNLSIHVAIDEQIDHIHLPMEVRRNLFLIFKEAINNVLKHAAATELSVSIAHHQKSLEIRISDNGRGFDIDASHTGNGLSTLQSRARACKGALRFTSELNNGTSLLLTIPAPRYKYARLLKKSIS